MPSPYNYKEDEKTSAQNVAQTGQYVPPGTGGFDATGNLGTVPLSGFASNFPSSVQANALYDSPWAALPFVFGMAPGSQQFNRFATGGGYQALRDFGADPLTLYNIMMGAGQQLGGGINDYANWLGALYANLGGLRAGQGSGPGGAGSRGFSGSELLGAIFNPRTDSTLQQILNAGDASAQARTIQALVRDATNVGMNPLAARGYQSAMQRALDAYNAQYIGSAADQGAAGMPAYEWLRQNYQGLIPQR